MQSLAELSAPNFQHPGPLEPNGQSVFPPSVQIVDFENKPALNIPWGRPPMYQQSKSGKYTVWQIMFNPDTQRIYNVSGQLEGKLRIFSNQVKVNKSGRDLYQQGQVDMDSKYDKKFKEGRRPFGSTVPVETFKVNLAKDYDPELITHFPVSGQTKIDGIRAYAKLDDTIPEGVSLKSRNHNEFPYLNNMRTQLKNFFSVLPAGTYIDGELFHPNLDFNKISSAVRAKGTMNPNNPDLYYYIFDMKFPDNPVWEDRLNLFAKYYNEFVKLGQPVDRVVMLPQSMLFSIEEIVSTRDAYLKQGFEGIMIRHFAGQCSGDPYLMDYPGGGKIKVCAIDPQTRTPESIKNSQYHESRNSGDRPINLMKFKDLIEEEGIVVDIIPDKNENGMIVIKDIRGNVFSTTPSETHVTRKAWLNHKDEYIGKPYTFVYQNTTPDGVPRFPIGKGFRTYE